jgi:phosphoesterase RecJ-like protein
VVADAAIAESAVTVPPKTSSPSSPAASSAATAAAPPAGAMEAAVPPAKSLPEPEWERAIALIGGAQRLLLCSHKKPDGDAIGSLLGLGHALASAGKDVTLACADAPANSLALLPGAERIVQDLRPRYSNGAAPPWDVIVVMDASGLDRLGELYDENRVLFETLPVVDIDHHITNDLFGAANVVDAGAAATTEVLALLLERMGIEPDVPAATCLLAGLMTDSLSFQTESTTPRTLRVAAALVEAGAPLAGIAFSLFRQRRRDSAILWSKALSTLQFAAGGRIGWVEVTRAMVEESGPEAESGGFSSFPASIAGVDVGFLVEEGKDGNVYVGFRSQSVDVAALAGEFGGGGHKRAAGCHFKAPATIGEALAQLLPVIERHLPPVPPG